MPGTNLQALIDATQPHRPLAHARISLVISNRKAATGLGRAERAGIATDVLALQTYRNHHPGATREDYDVELARRIVAAQPSLVVLAGFMHIVSTAFLSALVYPPATSSDEPRPIPIINLHPALPGAFDGKDAIRRAHEAFERGEIDKTGVMVHEVVPEVDRGRPIVVREIPLHKGETLEELEARMHVIEHEIIVEAAAEMVSVHPLSK